MKKVLLLTSMLAMIAFAGFSQTDRFWSANNENRSAIVKDRAVSRQAYPTDYKLFNLNTSAMRQELFSIVGRNATQHSTIISLPNAAGVLENFEVYEASNFEPALQAQFPEIRAYSGKGISDKLATVKLSISPQGIQTMVFRTEKRNEFIEAYSQDHNVYAVYHSQRSQGQVNWSCSTPEQAMAAGLNAQVAATARVSSGTIKTMRLAQSCNGEYANFFGATSAAQVGLVLAAFNATLTRCNGIYEKDLALHLNLIANTTSVIYYAPATDPYSTTLSQWNAQLQSTLTSVIGEANYDIGHLFGASGGGGNAGCIGCVCVNGSKGSGITSPADGIPQGDNFDIDYVAHEVGHQLGGNHTFSMSSEGTGVNKEVGSGITIMGYAGITAQDVAPHSIDIFHQATINQIQTNLATKTCPVTVTMTANHAPVVATVTNRTIPISTPFELTGSATDPEGDALTYCWEQNDNSTTTGAGSVASPTKTTGPNWLTFPATVSGTRTFPRLSTILSGLSVTPPHPGGDAGANIEALSSVSRTLNFTLTVRDNNPYNPGVTIGQTATTDVVVTVSNTSGPFAVTAPNTAVTWGAGGNATVTWSVNNTTAAPVSCASVNILLSTDGGQTFPTVLATATANDGSEVVTVPNIQSTSCRIRVEAVGNIFFDISNANFTIGAPPACGDATGLTASAVTQTSATISWSAVSGANNYDVDYKTSASGTWTNAATATTATSVNLSGLASNTVYDWRVRANCTAGAGNYVQAQFTTLPVVAGCVTAFEPNETQATAAAITAGAANSAAISTATDNDYFNITTTGTSNITYSLVGPAGVDFDMTILNSAGTSIGSGTGSTATETVTLNNQAAGTYSIRIFGFSGANSQSCYTLTVTVTPVAGGCASALDNSTNGTIGGAATIPFNTDVKGTVGVSGDNDYYKFVITTGGTITMTLTTLPANYHLRLLNSTGGTLQTSSNGGTTSETINRTVTPGTYYARVYPSNNNQFNATSCYTLRVQLGTAARPGELEIVSDKLNVFPNPVHDVASLMFNAEQAGTAELTITSKVGAIVMRKTITADAGTNDYRLNVSKLPAGVYFVKLQTANKVQMAKVVVTK